MNDELNRLHERHRTELAKRQAAFEGRVRKGLELPDKDSLWRRDDGRVYSVRAVDPDAETVFMKELVLDGFWRGPLESFLEKFKPTEGNEK